MTAIVQRQDINDAILQNAQQVVREEDDRYRGHVKDTAAKLLAWSRQRCPVLLCGPSSSGKTTTAHRLQQELQRHGRHVYTVSLDDFYLGRGKAPRLPDGSFDYETVEALNLPLLHQCITELMEEGTAHLPQFDFHGGEPKPDSRLLHTEPDAVIIFEGIHALNPLVQQQLATYHPFKILINTMTDVYNNDDLCLTGRDTRLIRRLVRDSRFRNSPPENTLDMWRQVIRGEDLYLFPYAQDADVQFDTFHRYELPLLSAVLVPMLTIIPETSPFFDQASALAKNLVDFVPLSQQYLAPRSLLREFIG